MKDQGKELDPDEEEEEKDDEGSATFRVWRVRHLGENGPRRRGRVNGVSESDRIDRMGFEAGSTESSEDFVMEV